jgi:hypothetical protein
MRLQSLSAASVILLMSFIYISCQKSTEQQESPEMKDYKGANPDMGKSDVTPYQFERINENNFTSQGWVEQQVNIVSGNNVFSDQSDYVQIVCGPENNTDNRLIEGSITMNLPTAGNPTLRRIRLRRGGYNGTRLADLTELKFSTYLVHGSTTSMVLQVDSDNDGDRDFNIFYNPLQFFQGAAYIPVILNTWQQWNALQGKWHIEGAELSEFPTGEVTIQELISAPAYADARIIDLTPLGHEGEGVRFTIGGNPRNLFDNTIGYFDALIIGTQDRQHSTLFDFKCNQSPD